MPLGCKINLLSIAFGTVRAKPPLPITETMAENMAEVIQ
jgi:hypothetical protein